MDTPRKCYAIFSGGCCFWYLIECYWAHFGIWQPWPMRIPKFSSLGPLVAVAIVKSREESPFVFTWKAWMVTLVLR